MTESSFWIRLLRQLGLYHPSEQRLSGITLRARLKVASAAFVALYLTTLVSAQVLNGTGHLVLLASMGASAVLLFALPGSPLARPWCFGAGHLLPAAVGLTAAHLLDNFALMAAVTIAGVLLVMYLFECMHPPGAATAMVPVLATQAGPAPGFDFLLFPVGLNLLLMGLAAWLLRRYWLPVAPVVVRTAAPPLPTAPAEPNPSPVQTAVSPQAPVTSALQSADWHAAVNSFDAVLDISEADLARLFSAAQQHAISRHCGALQCQHLMQAVPATVRPDSSLSSSWNLLRRQHMQLLPVTDLQGHLLGGLSLADFVRDLTVPHYWGLLRHLQQFQLKRHHQSRYLRQVSQLMQTEVPKVRSTDPIGALLPVLQQGTSTLALVVDEHNRLCGQLQLSQLLTILGTTSLQTTSMSAVSEQPAD
jgi:CBS domain-containing membrane protein